MSKAIRMISLIMTTILVLGLLSACTNGASSSTAPSSQQPAASASTPASSAAPASPDAGSAEPEIVELSVCRSQSSWGNTCIDPDLMDAFVAELEKATNTKIEMISPPHNDYREKLNVLLTSGDIPDVFAVQLALDNVPVYAVRGYIAPMDDYVGNNDRLNEYLPTINTDAFRVQGKLYGLPDSRAAVKIFHFRSDLVGKYGINLKDTMTTQEFYDEMIKVNQSEAIPFCFPKWTENFQLFYGAFNGYAGILKDASGKYYDGFQTQEIKEGILYIKSLYDAGILDKEFITNENAMMREKYYTGKAVSMSDYYTNYTQMMIQADNVGMFTESIPVFGLTGPGGTTANLNEAAQNAMCISNTVSDPQRAVDVIAYLNYSAEGVIMRQIGVEGKHFNLVDNVIIPTDKAKNAGYNLSPGQLSNSIPSLGDIPFSWGGIGDTYWSKQVEAAQKSVADGTLGPKHTVPSGISELYDRNAAGYLQNMLETATKVVLGNTTIDQAFTEYDSYWKSIQGDEMLAQLNAG